MASPPPSAIWSWSPVALVSISSRTARLAAARRQARLMQEWRRGNEAELARVDQILTAAVTPADELEAEQIRMTAPLGRLLQTSVGLGQSRRSPRQQQSHEELHARYLSVGRQLQPEDRSASSC